MNERWAMCKLSLKHRKIERKEEEKPWTNGEGSWKRKETHRKEVVLRPKLFHKKFSAHSRNRTWDLCVHRQLLYTCVTTTTLSYQYLMVVEKLLFLTVMSQSNMPLSPLGAMIGLSEQFFAERWKTKIKFCSRESQATQCPDFYILSEVLREIFLSGY